MTIKLKNNVVGYLATTISASDVGIALQAGNGASFPSLGAGEYFFATLESTGGTVEVVKVTARVGDSMTIVRAQDGSSAAGFAAGSRVEMRVNAQTVIDAVSDGIRETDTSIKLHASTAIPAGGTTGAGLEFSSATNFGVFFGSGAPTLSAAKGSLYLRSDGSSTTSRIYVNTDGSTGWTAITTVA